jgi:hypothetical protein
MSLIIDTDSERRLPGKFATGLALSAFLVLGGLIASASAQPYHNDQHHNDQHHNDQHGGGYNGGGRPGGGGGGYYPAPPVVYATPYYPPPVVYGPAIGIYVPSVIIGVGN